MYPDCRCHDDLGSLMYIGDDRLAAPYDEVFDAPDAMLGALAFTDDDGIELGALEYVDFEDDGLDGFMDVFDAGAKILDKLSGGSKDKARKAQRQAGQERQRADRLQNQLDQQRLRAEQAREREQIARARQVDANRRREMAELEQQVTDLRSQQAVVRSRINKEKLARRKRMMWIGGSVLALGTAGAVGVTALKRAAAPAARGAR